MDRDKLSVIHSALTSYKPEIIRDACIELTSDTFEDFPAEIFIQRPEIVFALQDILLVNSNPALKSLAAQAISCLCLKLINRFLLCTEVKSSQKDAILLMTLPQSSGANNDDSNVNESQDDNSFADQINTTKLKRSQLEPYEFCLMILSNAAAAFQYFDQLRPANACIELFENALKLVHVVFEAANLKGQKDLVESVLEIQNELLKSLLMHQKSRPTFLMLLKISVKFLDVSDELDGGLVAFIQKCAYDPTLYLSHKWLHEKLASENFKSVLEMMTSMKHSIKVIQNSSDEPIKVQDLGKSLKSLKYHENYKKFIPLVMQKARSIRDPDEISKMSMLITQMLQFPHVQVCQETHFQLHGLVQDILGIGQALDIQGSKKLELSFMIYDKGNIVQELLKSSLENDELVKKAAIEIVLYLLKSEKVLGKQLWKIVKNEIIQPNQALLECCVQAEDQINLSRWILSNLMPDDLSHFEANLRLLLTSKNISIRRDAQAQIRTILSKQSSNGPQTKLPRFGTILQTDLSELCNTAFSREKIHLNLRTVKNNTNNSVEHVSVKDLLNIITISPEYDVLTKKSALQQLGLLLEETSNAKDFKEFGGLNIVLDLMDKCLEEKSSTSDLLPFALQTLKTICLHDRSFVEFLKMDTEENCYKQMLYVLTRSLYIYQEDSQDVLENIVTILVLTLFHDWLNLDDSNRLSMPSFMMNKLNLPIEFCTCKFQ